MFLRLWCQMARESGYPQELGLAFALYVLALYLRS
jgi:hypothetical protein